MDSSSETWLEPLPLEVPLVEELPFPDVPLLPVEDPPLVVPPEEVPPLSTNCFLDDVNVTIILCSAVPVSCNAGISKGKAGSSAHLFT